MKCPTCGENTPDAWSACDVARLGALVLFGLLMWRVAIYAMERKLVN